MIQIAAVLALAFAVQERPKATPEEQVVRDALARQAREVSDRSLAGITTLADWESRRDETRRRLRSALGLDPLPERTPLHPVITSSFDEAAFRVETLLFQALPGFYLTANLYLPKDGTAKRPGILYVCGHSPDPLGAKVKYQKHPVWLASHGYAVLIVDPIQISEIEAIHHGTHRYGLWHWQALGYTPMGLEVWCAMRSLDYLASRPEVDAEKLGMTGRSGGGTMTWFTMALDPRVKVGVTANATGTVATHVAHDTLRGHCDCAFYINHPRIDYTDVAALCAPRPLLIQSGQKDWIYPPEGYRPLGEKARRIYTLYGAAEHLKEQDVDAKHEDLLVFRTEAFRWFERGLSGVTSDVEVTEVPEIDKEKLRAVRGPLPADVRNASIAEEFPGPWTSSAPRDTAAWDARARDLRATLDAMVFPGDPATPCELRPEPAGEEVRDGLAVRRFRVWSEEGIPITLEILGTKKSPLVLVGAGPAAAAEWKAFAKEMTVVRVVPRGEGWSPELSKFVRRSAPLVGRSLGTMQVYDLLRGVAAAKEILGAGRIALYGMEEGAMLALAASLRAPAERVLLHSLPDSLLAEPILLNAARVTDVPELLALAVPRGLVFLGRSPLGFDRARRIAALKGRPGLAIRAASAQEALDELARGVP